MATTRVRLPQAKTVAHARIRSRATVVRPVAFMDKIAEGFVRVFSPNSTIVPNAPKSWPDAGFSGRTRHDRERKPFTDNYANTSSEAKEKAMEPVEPSAMDYLNEAAQNVVAHNFESSQDRKAAPSRAHLGWSGDVSRNRNKPFADDYANTSAEAKAKAAEPEEPSAVDYMNEAAQNIVSHNFEHSKDRSKPHGGHVGYSGDTHARGKDGFHSTKL